MKQSLNFPSIEVIDATEKQVKAAEKKGFVLVTRLKYVPSEQPKLAPKIKILALGDDTQYIYANETLYTRILRLEEASPAELRQYRADVHTVRISDCEDTAVNNRLYSSVMSIIAYAEKSIRTEEDQAEKEGLAVAIKNYTQVLRDFREDNPDLPVNN